MSAGKRMKSAVCATEIMVIAAPDGEVDLCCGGTAMGDGESNGGAVDADHADGTAIGKRYVNEDGSLEVLCVKAGEGSLSVGGSALNVKDAKKLPKTD
ncbi:MAG: hypothetical protein OXG82_21450 [Gammaproteobacteria bacterium]|nr:hypothetical protein [Gammaproteobacteria bacterium]